jgi:hypothetical protein
LAIAVNRPLTAHERSLARWLLEHGTLDAEPFLSQVDAAEVTAWRCKCGCASINFQVRGHPPAPPGVHILSDYLFGGEDDLSGVFIFESGGLLSGLEVYGLAGDAPRFLPRFEALRPASAIRVNKHEH